VPLDQTWETAVSAAACCMHVSKRQTLLLSGTGSLGLHTPVSCNPPRTGRGMVAVAPVRLPPGIAEVSSRGRRAPRVLHGEGELTRLFVESLRLALPRKGRNPLSSAEQTCQN
jgi:hypothetical protein